MDEHDAKPTDASAPDSSVDESAVHVPAPTEEGAVEPSPEAPADASAKHVREPAAVGDPPRRANRLLTWIGLAVCMVLVLPTLLPALRGPLPTTPPEARAVATSLQTWQHFHQQSDTTRLFVERVEPYLNRRSQSHHAPGLVWLHMTAFRLALGDDPSVQEAVAAARLLSCLAVVIIVGAAFWAAYSIGGHWAGPMAGLICATNPALLHFGRTGTATAPALAMETLSIAAALWAIRPLRPSPSTERQFLGWLLCGILAGMATILRGPWALVDVAVIVLVLVVLCPGRVSHVLGLLAALLIAVLLVGPWGMYAYQHAPEGLDRWWENILPAESSLDAGGVGARVAERNLMLLAITLPWTLWVVGAVLQPFSTSSRGARIRLFLGLIWALAAATFFMCRPGETRLADAIVVVPAWAVVLALLFSRYGELADEGRSPRTWRVLRWPHLVLLLVASGLVPAAFYARTDLPEGTLREMWRVVVTPWWMPWMLGAALMSIALFSLFRFVARDLPRRSLAAWSVWTIVLAAGAGAASMTTGDHAPGRVASMVQRTENATLIWVPAGWADVGRRLPDPRLLLHTRGREIKVATPDQVAEVAAVTEGPIYLFSVEDPALPDALRTVALEHDPVTGLTLYRVPATKTDALIP